MYFLRFTEAVALHLFIGRQLVQFQSIQMSVYSLMDLEVFDEPEFVEWMK